MLDKQQSGLLILDLQEKMLNRVERAEEVVHISQQVAKGFETFGCPVVVAEQDPQIWGATSKDLLSIFSEQPPIFSKTSFSCLGDPELSNTLMNLPVKQWVIVGLQAHVSVLQTARDLIDHGRDVIVLNDAISSRSIFDYSTAIAELKESGARISSAEIVLYELLGSSTAPEFETISALIP